MVGVGRLSAGVPWRVRSRWRQRLCMRLRPIISRHARGNVLQCTLPSLVTCAWPLTRLIDSLDVLVKPFNLMHCLADLRPVPCTVMRRSLSKTATPKLSIWGNTSPSPEQPSERCWDAATSPSTGWAATATMRCSPMLAQYLCRSRSRIHRS